MVQKGQEVRSQFEPYDAFMTNKHSTLGYSLSPNRKGIRFIIAGSCLMFLGLLMAIVGASVFVLPAMPARPVYLLGAGCFTAICPWGSRELYCW